MSDTGKNIVDGFSELRKFCHQVSLLLRTASTMLGNAGWERGRPSSVFSVHCVIDNPDRWLPYEFCRFFTNTAHPCLLPFVAVNLGDPEGGFSIDSVLLSAGCIVFQAGGKPDKAEHWWSRWHLYMGDNRKDDGTPCVDEPQKTWKLEEGWDEPPAGVLSVTTFAYPLVEITDSEALRVKIVKRLLKLIENEAKGK